MDLSEVLLTLMFACMLAAPAAILIYGQIKRRRRRRNDPDWAAYSERLREPDPGRQSAARQAAERRKRRKADRGSEV